MRQPSAVAAVVLAVGLLLTGATPLFAQRRPAEPETGSGRAEKSASVARRFMVSAANPLAAEAGREILREGGSAADAAIAVQLVLSLVEPQSSGLGGGGFLLHWDAQRGALRSYDGRETAPASALPERFLDQGRPRPFDAIVHSGLSIGAPGLVRLLETAHKAHGRLPWARLLEPAIRLAEQGFALSPRLHLLLRWMGARSFDPTARAYFYTPTGSALPIGTLIRNPQLAQVLRRLAREGAPAFYSGAIAHGIVAAVRTAPNASGDLTEADIAAYRVVERPPFCFPYRRHRVCSMGPPSSGGPALAQILMLLEPFDLGRSRSEAMSGHALHLIAEAQKLAYADRARFVADPDHVPVPDGLADPGYIGRRRGLIDATRAMARPQPGEPPGFERRSLGADATEERAGTTHVSIVDADGNAVAMTSTVEGAFGSRIMTQGFLLNNQLTDFSFLPRDAHGRPAANGIGPGKRPRSSMAPTMVFDEAGRLVAVLGSPGGPRIIMYVAKALIGLIDWKMGAQEAAALINFGSRGTDFEVELGGDAVWHSLKLKPYGHKVSAHLMTSGLHIVVRRDGMLEGGADPRREGVAIGD